MSAHANTLELSPQASGQDTKIFKNPWFGKDNQASTGIIEDRFPGSLLIDLPPSTLTPVEELIADIQRSARIKIALENLTFDQLVAGDPPQTTPDSTTNSARHIIRFSLREKMGPAYRAGKKIGNKIRANQFRSKNAFMFSQIFAPVIPTAEVRVGARSGRDRLNTCKKLAIGFGALTLAAGATVGMGKFVYGYVGVDDAVEYFTSDPPFNPDVFTVTTAELPTGLPNYMEPVNDRTATFQKLPQPQK